MIVDLFFNEEVELRYLVANKFSMAKPTGDFRIFICTIDLLSDLKFSMAKPTGDFRIFICTIDLLSDLRSLQ